jgi:folate-binding protein YgfZ
VIDTTAMPGLMTSPFPVIGSVRGIMLDGSDARRFAQAQFSGDVDALQPGHWQWNAWLTAQGLVQALMHLVDAGDGRLLAVLRGGDAESIRAALARYVLRLRVGLTVEHFTAFSGGPLAAGTVGREADTLVLGYGDRSLRLGSPAGVSPDPVARDRWRRADIRQGWPCLPPGEPVFLPPALGLERLRAVALEKGCYPGQEIVARLHYRGRHKWRLCRLHGPASLPSGEIRDPTGTTIAWVIDALSGEDGIEALAVVHVDSRTINILDNVYTVNSAFEP